jgi:hypothetical protein
MGRDEPSLPKNMESVTDIVYLGQIGGDKNDSCSSLQQFGEEFVDFDFRTDIDAYGGFVENEKAGTVVEPFSDDDFLLISAGKTRRGSVARSCFDLHIPMPVVRRL